MAAYGQARPANHFSAIQPVCSTDKPRETASVTAIVV